MLVFSLSARQEAERKLLFGNNNKSRAGQFFQILISETERIAAASGVDVFWFDKKKQQGNNFGSRFTNAFQEIFNAGYENVISIGNDCPYLTSEVLEKAIQNIQYNDMVLGPANDGGAYLIGLNKSAFNAETFQSLSWQQESLFEEFLALGFREQQSIECLEELSDVDKLQDFLELMSLQPETFIQFIQYCLKSFSSKVFTLPILFKNQFRYVYFSLRAPPRLSNS